MSVDRVAITVENAPVPGDLGKSIFPTFAVNVPLPVDTVAPAPETPATTPAPSSPAPAAPTSDG